MNDTDAALEMLAPVFKSLTFGFLNHTKIDPDLDPIRNDPRFKAMIADAEARIAAANDGDSAQASSA